MNGRGGLRASQSAKLQVSARSGSRSGSQGNSHLRKIKINAKNTLKGSQGPDQGPMTGTYISAIPGVEEGWEEGCLKPFSQTLALFHEESPDVLEAWKDGAKSRRRRAVLTQKHKSE